MTGDGGQRPAWQDEFSPADDGLHDPGSDFYFNETFWFSFFAPDRGAGAWLYSGIRPVAGVTTGGLWLWDRTGVSPWEIPFYERFNWLKVPAGATAEHAAMPNGVGITTVEPGMRYDLRYDDRQRMTATLRFTGMERPVPLRTGTPPYPKATHYDQTGHVAGHVVLDGERIDIDCYAMRDRSWGTRKERGYQPVGYTWLADANQSLLAFSVPTPGGDDEIYAGYLRQGDTVSYLAAGRRAVRRDPRRGWVTSMDLAATDSRGRQVRAHGDAISRMILPHSTSLCVATLFQWDVGGVPCYGEDQDVWSLRDWHTLTRRQ